MATSNRKTGREALAALFSASLTGAGQPIQAVYDHVPAKFNGQSPITTVSNGGVEHEDSTYGEEWGNTWYLLIANWVLVADAASNWTEADAEGALDNVEQAQANLLKSNRSESGGAWDFITYDGRSQILRSVKVGGDTYDVEVIPVRLEKDD